MEPTPIVGISQACALAGAGSQLAHILLKQEVAS
jgi:hypothetical protein